MIAAEHPLTFCGIHIYVNEYVESYSQNCCLMWTSCKKNGTSTRADLGPFSERAPFWV